MERRATEGKPSQRRQARKREPAPLSEVALQAIERDYRGPHRETMERLVWNLRKARQEKEEVAWQLTELSAEKEHRDALRELEAQRTKHRVLLVVEPDGFASLYADDGIAVRVIELLPWDDDQMEQACRENSHWKEIWWPGSPKATAMPHYLSRPNEFSDEALLNALAWQKRCEVMQALQQIADLARMQGKIV